MGLTAIISSAGNSVVSSSTSVVSLLSPIGLGIGGILVAAALVFLLAYFDVLSATEDPDESVRMTLLASIIPLATAFLGVIVFKTLTFL